MNTHKADTKPKRAKRKRVMESEGLPMAWKKILDRNYSVFRDKLNIDKLIVQMSDEQQSKFKDMQDSHQRIDHLIKHILPNGTKSLVEEFKNGLKLSGQEHRIKYVPGNLAISQPKRRKLDDMPIMIHVNGLKYVKLMK